MDLLDFRLKPLRDYLPEQTYAEVCRRAQRREFGHGDALQMRGDKTVRLCIVAAGAARLGRFQHDGAFTMISMVGVGGHFGEVGLQRNTQTHDVYAVGKTQIDILEAPALEDLLRNHAGFAMGLWRCNTARLNALLELYDDVRTLSVSQRLGKVLYLHTGQGNLPDGVECLQRDLSELLGVSQVSIGTALKELEKLGLAKAGYRRVTVPDKRKLGRWLRSSGAA